MMQPRAIVNKILNSITYILPTGNKKECWLVDCGDVKKVIEQGWYIKGVLLTHAHTDHIYGLNRLVQEFPDALVYTNLEGKLCLQNPKWNFSRYHGDVEDFIFQKPENIRIIESEGNLRIEGTLAVNVLFTPGHEPSCLSYKIENMIFTGDSYIPGINIVTSFPRSNKSQALTSLEKLQKMERSGVEIKPGHLIENKTIHGRK